MEYRRTDLIFNDLCVNHPKEVLKHVSGVATRGNILAVMGPSGSGKTTLLNALAGRVHVTSGKITLDGSSFGKQQRRRLGYVLQDDVFLSNLTLWETLYFTAILSMPKTTSQEQKLKQIDSIVTSLGLEKCLHTVVGDIFNRGLSGGERKRTSIACELLRDPDLLLIDEPTSGLDSSIAHDLMVQLRDYATNYNKTLVTTIHQPSSQVFHMFSNLLLLLEGQVVYFGPADSTLSYLTSLGISIPDEYNPADILLDVITSDSDTVSTIKEGAIQKSWLTFCDKFEYIPRKNVARVDDNSAIGTERGVVRKERSAGMYRLSTYYLSKMTSELPFVLINPVLMISMIYWVVGLGEVDGYFVFLGIGILYTLMMQSVGLVIGFCSSDLRFNMVVVFMCLNVSLNIGAYHNED
ncbi:uncharacterized protein LOC132555552 [Ylistrum balloti]|uniref:uncharacterized protein LOC132555552 n=1 Tax=Ylistrum balloti TaxID=509963 RepID=UPI002905D972|nr:uncharacterized protein LOC132555552 [Ylistrum balloti]